MMRSAWFAAIVIVAATTAAMAADDGWETYRFPKLGIEIQLPGEVRIEEFNHGDGWGGFAANIRLLPGRSKARIAINVIVKHGILSVDELRSYISGWSGMKWRDITLGPFVVGEKRARFLRKGLQRLKFPKNLQRKKKQR